jgi:glycosyltransferase involved in cell wall biosynthesis
LTALVSILIPAYNAEKWIGETITSALNQTWPRKEIVIVDDGSSDDTLRIAKHFESNLVKIVSQENRGASAARNKALELAQGEYIQWLDADDLLASDKISVQMEAADRSQTGLTLYSGPHGTFYWRPEKAIFVPNSLWRDLSPVDWMIIKFSGNVFIAHGGWLVNRLLTEKSGPWDERLSLDDDGEYFSRVVASSERIEFVREARYYYRQSSVNQLSRKMSEELYRSSLLSTKLSIQYLRSMEESERIREACLALLQSTFDFFYPDKTGLIEEMNTLASELGGKLLPPNFSWKFNLARRLLGWNLAKEIRHKSRKLKLGIVVKLDRMMYGMTKSSQVAKEGLR